MKIFRIFAIVLAIAFAGVAAGPIAHAGDPQIETAKADGTVGERIDGLLGIIGTAEPTTVRKVNEINNKRRAAYSEMAIRTGTSIDQVARVIGEKQIVKTKAGHYYMGEDGRWTRK